MANRTQQTTFFPSEAGNTVIPAAYIYKTTKDYSHNVPVIMDSSRTRIVSYPAPSDLSDGGKLRLPAPLDNGYWLDNRGITPDVAFLSYTYEEYSRLQQAPSMEELLGSIVDKHPLVTIVSIGKRAGDSNALIEAANGYIKKNNLK